MTWRFRKSFSPLPGVRITLSPGGLSTSVGAGPFRLTAGPRGMALTGRIPGTGVSYRHAFSKSVIPERSREAVLSPDLDSSPPLPSHITTANRAEVKEVKSGGAQSMTTPGLAEFKRLLARSHEERDSIEGELERTRGDATEATIKYTNWRDGFALRRIF